MRIRVAYLTRYDYDGAAKMMVQLLRLTPRDHDGQNVLRWRLETEPETRLRAGEDALGNLTQTLYAPGPIRRLAVRVLGEVDTWDTGGVVRGTLERFPPMVYLRETALTHPDAALKALAARVAGEGSTTLERLHRLLAVLHAEMRFDIGRTDAATPAAEAYALGHGVCQDLAHVFVSAARVLGAPARYVSGHLVRADGQVDQEAAHAWAEAYVEDLGWVGFDPANGVCPTEAYLRVAVGLDYLGAAPVRGSRYGGGAERLEVRLRVEDAGQ